jgi:hypothetical protein
MGKGTVAGGASQALTPVPLPPGRGSSFLGNARPRVMRPTADGRASLTIDRIFGLDGRESYRELRVEPLCCPLRLSRGTAPHEREFSRGKGRF